MDSGAAPRTPFEKGILHLAQTSFATATMRDDGDDLFGTAAAV